MNTKEDFKILQKLKDGDHTAYKELFDLYYIPLSIYSLKFCNSLELAEDITQDIFVKFWDEKIYLKLEGSIGPYLFKSIKNNTLQSIKKESRYHFEEVENQADELEGDEMSDIEHLESEKNQLLKEVDSLPEKSKEVFKAIVFGGLKYKEVAEQLNVSVNTVKTHYSRALKKLRDSLIISILLFLI